jgi:asparagine synthase (glutamine-hydrolysing)
MATRRRILLVVENVALARDHRLRKQAATLVDAGYDVSVICRADPSNALDGARLYQYPAPKDGTSKLGYLREYGWSWTAAAWLTLKAFCTNGFDALQISGTPDIYFTIGAPFRLLGKRLVLDQRDLSPELYELRYGRRGRVYRLLLRLERASYRRSDHVVTVNRTLERVAYERGSLASGRVTVVGNGPRLDRVTRGAKRPELKQGKRFLCCWLGLMGPQDRVDVALRAVAHLVHEQGRRDCQFAFLGDGEARPEAERLALALDLADWVSFPGWVDEETAFAYLATADLGIEPNLEDLVTPVKGMEYMAFGLPFVAFDVTETRVLADDAAAYAPPGDTAAMAKLVDELLDDPDRRTAMGTVGRQRIEQSYAWDHQALAYLDVYRRLLRNEEG